MLVEESPATMPRSGAYLTSIKGYNYSHCPLKKRPVTFFQECTEDARTDMCDDNNSEPENLSTKPQDLSIKNEPSTTVVSSASVPVPPVDLVTPPRPVQPIAVKSSSGGGPLEPLNLNTHHHAAAAHPWSANSYLFLPYHHQYHHQSELLAQQPRRFHPTTVYPTPTAPEVPALSPYAPRESSPPHAGFLTSALPHHPPSAPLYLGYPMDPASPPQDLSSPGSTSSVRSAGSTGSGHGMTSVTNVARSNKRRDEPASRFQCPDCGKSYSTHSGLSKHQQFHCAASEGSQARAKAFSCKFCEKVYVSLGALKMHIRTHTLPCKCKLCGKAFSRPWLLQGHIRTHTGEKPFSCHHCDRAFADRSNLRAHLQTHSDVKKYSCRTCSKQFTRMSLLSKHTEGGCPGAQLSPPPTQPPMTLWTHQPQLV